MALLGAIADDLTGATDLANNLVRAGMRVVQTFGVPDSEIGIDADAIVVALKSRTIPADEAVAQSLQACRWLRRQGARQIYFKYCSTFDSTPQGNIGPVTEALMDELGCGFVIATPAFPDAGRTVYQGHLFLGDALLSETHMRNHPLTPMTDANLVRVLQAQLDPRRGRKVGLVSLDAVAQSPAAIGARIAELRRDGFSIAIADAVSNQDLLRLAAALHDAHLVAAASGLAIGLPANWGLAPTLDSARLPAPMGAQAIVAGSCSAATLRQVQAFIAAGGCAHRLDPFQVAADEQGAVAAALAWAQGHWPREPHLPPSPSSSLPLLVYSTAEPEGVAAVQQRLGTARAGAMIERALAAVARGLVEQGAGQLVVAGGETAGACASALEIRQMQIGPQIDPGAPWCYAASPQAPWGGLHVAFKSGNFGSPDFFTRAFALLHGRS
jgi:3-dehydrotetronate 4-kinase